MKLSTLSQLLAVAALAVIGLAEADIVNKNQTHIDRELKFRYPNKTNATKQFNGSVNVRLHWERSYYWQETYNETWWCMEPCKQHEAYPRANVSCIPGLELFIRPCDEYSRSQQFIRGAGGTMRLSMKPTTCVTRVEYQRVQLFKCVSGDPNQVWKTFATSGAAFALTNNILGPDYVMGQHHHPTDREKLYMKTLRLAKAANTVYWEAWPRP